MNNSQNVNGLDNKYSKKQNNNFKENENFENMFKKNMFKDLKISERKNEIKIGVIAGGFSSEREVSLSTGRGIFEALVKLGYNTIFIDLKDNIFNSDFLQLLRQINIAFIALHGKFGEDGTIQGMLELLKIPYTGSGVLSSAIAMDKIFSKKIFKFEGIPTPDFIVVTKDYFGLKSLNSGNLSIKKIIELNEKVLNNFGYPVIVKPNKGGSSIGVTILEDSKNLDKLFEAVKTAFKYDDEILIEKYIKGRLLTVSIIGKNPIALPIIEIKPKSGFYDYKSKYTPGYTEYIVPAPIENYMAEEISSIALKCHKVLACNCISRVDLIISSNLSSKENKNNNKNNKKNKNNYNYSYNYNNNYNNNNNRSKSSYDKNYDIGYDINVLEVNTIPGMTPTSLVPKAANACGISFEKLVEIILDGAELKLQ